MALLAKRSLQLRLYDVRRIEAAAQQSQSGAWDESEVNEMAVEPTVGRNQGYVSKR
jgi:hypothetical protein